jgi:hypothetical protein
MPKAAPQAVHDLEIVKPEGTPTAHDLITAQDQTTLKRTEAYLAIKDDDQCAKAYEAMQWLTTRIKAIRGNPIIAKLLKSAKQVVADIKEVPDTAAAPFEERERAIRIEISRFETARENARRRVEAENNRRNAEAAKPKAMKPAEVTTRSGDTFTFKPSTPTPITTVAKAEKPEGTTTRTYYSSVLGVARTKDDEPIVNVDEGLMTLIQAVAKGKAPALLLQLNQREADKLADVYKEQLAIPGLLWKREVKPVIGSRR